MSSAPAVVSSLAASPASSSLSRILASGHALSPPPSSSVLCYHADRTTDVSGIGVEGPLHLHFSASSILGFPSPPSFSSVLHCHVGHTTEVFGINVGRQVRSPFDSPLSLLNFSRTESPRHHLPSLRSHVRTLAQPSMSPKLVWRDPFFRRCSLRFCSCRHFLTLRSYVGSQ